MTSRKEVRLRPLAEDERPRLFTFYRETLRASERVIRLYEWRLRGRPASGGVETYVAEREGQLVGAVNAVPVRLSSRGEVFEAVWQQDSIVHPDARGQGIGSRLISYAASQSPIALAKGTVKPMYRLRKRAGFTDVPRDTYLLKPTKPFPGGRRASLKRRALFPAFWLAGQLTKRVPTRLQTVEIDRFDASFDRLAEALKERRSLRVYKPSAYLNWRYFTCPIRRYRVYAALRAAEPAGAAVLRTDGNSSEDAWIVDLILDEGDTRVAHTLLNVVSRRLGESAASAARTFATSPRLRRLLILRGFLPTSETPHFTYLVADDRRFPSGCTWSFLHGDGDTELLD